MERGELIAAVVSDRVAGMRYKEIAERHGISVSMLRQLLTQSVAEGMASYDAIFYAHGTPAPMPGDDYDAQWIERVLKNIKVSTNGCWIWQGFVGTWGYGSTQYLGRNKILHRQFYQITNKVRLDRWQLVMHKCDQRLCINPLHLQIGTPGDNVLDAADKGRHHNARKTHCKRGHEFTPENTRMRVTANTAMRTCLTCEVARFETPKYKAKALERQRRYRAQRKARSV